MLRGLCQSALISCLLLTSVALGIARGTVSVDGHLVLCTGEGVVVVPNPDGGGTATHICPDMALALLAATFGNDVTLPPRSGTDQHEAILAAARADNPVPMPSARAPPVHQIA